MERRTFLGSLGAVGALMGLLPRAAGATPQPALLKPPRLRPGEVVGLVNPAGATFVREDLELAKETVVALGLTPRVGAHALERYGYLAGNDRERADDLNQMLSDTSVRAILAIRGGWGCARVLPLLQYANVLSDPKIVIGYSDITAILLALHARTGLVTFHGPVGISSWNSTTVDWFRRILFDGEAVVMQNPQAPGDALVRTKDRTRTIRGGTARGKLLGGNLSVLAGLVGTSYLPSWEGAILFLEDDGEHIYRVDRMLTQLRLAGVLERLAGFVFGKCTGCGPGEGYGSLTLEEVLDDHVGGLGIPAWSGAMIGHIEDKFTVPVGLPAEIDADRGSITLMEPAVV
jgi:muramoyltetrapeptide carboxypeptidase